MLNFNTYENTFSALLKFKVNLFPTSQYNIDGTDRIAV